MSDAKAKDAKDKDKKGKGKDDDDAPKASKLPLIIGLVNVLATGGVGAVVFLNAGASTGEEAIAPDAPTLAVKFEPFVVNLNETNSTRYLKATVQLEMRGEDAQEKFDSLKLKVRDQLLRYLSGLSIAETLGEENKTVIHDELLTRVHEHFGEDRIAGLYFSEFVVQ